MGITNNFSGKLNYKNRRIVLKAFYSDLSDSVKDALRLTKGQLEGRLEEEAYSDTINQLNNLETELRRGIDTAQKNYGTPDKKLDGLKGLALRLAKQAYALTEEDACTKKVKMAFDENLYTSLCSHFSARTYQKGFVEKLPKLLGKYLINPRVLVAKFGVPARLCSGYGESFEGIVFSALINSTNSNELVLNSSVALDDSRINPNIEVYVNAGIGTNGQRPFATRVFPFDPVHQKYKYF